MQNILIYSLKKPLLNFQIKYHPIDLEKNKKLLYKLIYSLRLLNLKMLKTCIKVNFKNRFNRSFKSVTKVLILFVKKPNS